MRTRLEAIDAILQSGVTSNAVDGESTSFNHDTLRRERLELRRTLGLTPKRHRVFVVVSRQVVIDSRFSTVICAPVFSAHDGLDRKSVV
jgi:hypothetical protein